MMPLNVRNRMGPIWPPVRSVNFAGQIKIENPVTPTGKGARRPAIKGLDLDSLHLGQSHTFEEAGTIEAGSAQTRKIHNAVDRITGLIGRKNGYEIGLVDDNGALYRIEKIDGNPFLQSGPVVTIFAKSSGLLGQPSPAAAKTGIKTLQYALALRDGQLQEIITLNTVQGQRITYTEPHALDFMNRKMATGYVNLSFLRLNQRVAAHILALAAQEEKDRLKKEQAAERTQREADRLRLRELRQAVDAGLQQISGAKPLRRGKKAKPAEGFQTPVLIASPKIPAVAPPAPGSGGMWTGVSPALLRAGYHRPRPGERNEDA